MSYLLTYNGPAVSQYLKTHNQSPVKCHVFRWGANWGYLYLQGSWDDAWTAEQQTAISYTSNEPEHFLLVKTTPQQAQAPPLKLDDMWIEELIYNIKL
jgi:hypothetical protein